MNTSNTPSITTESFETFLKKTGLDMEAVKVPTPNTMTGELESGFYSIHNKQTGKMIHSGVSKIFEVVQHREALSVIQDIANQRDIKLASGGIWNGGAQAYAQVSGWIQANCPLVDLIYILTTLPSSMSCVSA